MAWSFGCQLAGGKDGGNCRIALRFQRNDDLSGPSVRRANNVCVAVEVCDINPRRTRRPQNQIERCARQTIVTLMRHETSPKHVDRTRRRGKQSLAERRQHRRDQLEPSRQRGIFDVEHLGRGFAEMHNQIGTTL